MISKEKFSDAFFVNPDKIISFRVYTPKTFINRSDDWLIEIIIQGRDNPYEVYLSNEDSVIKFIETKFSRFICI